MKKIALTLLPLLFVAGCSNMTINGLVCPTNDQAQIVGDLQQCHVYDLDAVDKALQDPDCKACLEAKGYKVATDLNETK